MIYRTNPGCPTWNLDNRRVEVWFMRTDAGADDVRRFHSALSTDERERAARFRFARHREAFITARGSLRMLLSRYIGGTPEEVSFVYGSQGKPSCADSAIHFNLSHSGGLAVFAFSRAGDLGVDIEEIHPIPDLMDLAQRFFCPDEVRDLAALAEPQREHAFFLCWTRKEACIKATGNGLLTMLSNFRVSVEPDAPPRFLHFEGDVGAESWTLHNLDRPAGYAGALAYCDDPRPIVVSPVLSPEWLLELSS
jgi:4'-phosphopantetheinyl transferase